MRRAAATILTLTTLALTPTAATANSEIGFWLAQGQMQGVNGCPERLSYAWAKTDRGTRLQESGEKVDRSGRKYFTLFTAGGTHVVDVYPAQLARARVVPAGRRVYVRLGCAW